MKNEKEQRLGKDKYSNQGCFMKITEYNSNRDIIVEFQDEYKAKVHTTYASFDNGGVVNPYYPSVYGIGITGRKYPTYLNGKHTKEYNTWVDMLKRCFDLKYKEKYHTYQDVTCCAEWLLFENFYEWLHSQENFDKWINGNGWNLDKDILIKGNKVYSPDTCCLVSKRINLLFVKRNSKRGNLPIGVYKRGDKFSSECSSKKVYLGKYNTIEEAFYAYKKYKENMIKQIAKEEYNGCNITKQCYEAMMKYKVEITD